MTEKELVKGDLGYEYWEYCNVFMGQVIANQAKYTCPRKLLSDEVPDGDSCVDEDVVARPHQGSQGFGEFSLSAKNETTFLLQLRHLVVSARINFLHYYFFL